MVESRYVIGIDLGTTNCAVAYVDTNKEKNPSGSISQFLIQQLSMPGFVESKELLPSFCYLATDSECATGALTLPWEATRNTVVGTFAKDQGAKTPTKLIQSAKSWLCNSAAERREKILPPICFDPNRRLSPVDVSALYLRHIALSWNATLAKGDPAKEFEEQDMILTVPASFDEVARVLTLEAAKKAGLSKITLLEEPQAAFYSWIYSHHHSLYNYFKKDDIILVVDVGGGTTDFSLIQVTLAQDEEIGFQRRAVGNHLLLGGDNMDLAIAHMLESKNSVEEELSLLARSAKESFFSKNPPEKISLFLQGKGSKVIRGGVRIEVRKEEVQNLLKEGFFHEEPLESALQMKKKQALRSMGLSYESEPSILKHLAHFLHSNKSMPNYVLFNGGSMKPELFRASILNSIATWFQVPRPKELTSHSLDLAVSRGAAYFGRVQRGLGIRITGGLPRAYYLKIECKDEKRVALTLLSKGSPDGFIYESEHLFEAKTNTPITFQLLSSNIRLEDLPGSLVPILEEEMLFLPPIQTVLRLGKGQNHVKVRLFAELTHIGTVQLWLQLEKSDHKWLLEFQLKSKEGPENTLSSLEKRRVDETYATTDLESAKKLLKEKFKSDPKNVLTELETLIEMPKSKWPSSVLRSLFDTLFELKSDFFSNSEAELRFWNLAGFFLRPGFGYPLDDYRIKELWKIILAEYKKQKPFDCMIQKLICYRRISLGLNKGQQLQLASEILPELYSNLQGKKEGNIYEYTEKLRLAASLESINREQKIRLGDLLLKKISKGKSIDVDLFALGRIGSRHLIAAAFVHTLPHQDVEPWIETLLSVKTLKPLDKKLLLEKLARKVEGLEFNISSTLVEKILQEFPESRHLLTEMVSLELEEQEDLLGDTLPPGLTLVS